MGLINEAFDRTWIWFRDNPGLAAVWALSICAAMAFTPLRDQIGVASEPNLEGESPEEITGRILDEFLHIGVFEVGDDGSILVFKPPAEDAALVLAQYGGSVARDYACRIWLERFGESVERMRTRGFEELAIEDDYLAGTCSL